MTHESVLAVTAVWIAVGFIVLRWASEFASEESERELSERERALKENARQQARLAEELEAARVELRSLQKDHRASLVGRFAKGHGASGPCLEQ